MFQNIMADVPEHHEAESGSVPRADIPEQHEAVTELLRIRLVLFFSCNPEKTEHHRLKSSLS